MAAPLPADLALALRTGLPADLLELLRRYPRDGWEDHPKLDGLAGFWLQRHRMFRELSATIGKAVRKLHDGQSSIEEFSPYFERRVGRLLGELEEHHHVEDAHYFPAFAAAEPRLKRGFDILDADHHAIHAAIDKLGEQSHAFLAASKGWLGGRAGEMPRRVDELGGAVAAFDRNLLRHLDDEEDLIIPLILERARNDPEFR